MDKTAIKRNKPFLRRWIKALRSGKYEQATEVLHRTAADGGDEGYCCLGVACHISSKVKSRGPDENGHDWYEFFGEDCATEVGCLPESMLAYIGMTLDEADHLIAMNDARDQNFYQIADYIEGKILNG